jgi:hypothetical protein
MLSFTRLDCASTAGASISKLIASATASGSLRGCERQESRLSSRLQPRSAQIGDEPCEAFWRIALYLQIYQLNVTVMLLAPIFSVYLKTYSFPFMINGEISILV